MDEEKQPGWTPEQQPEPTTDDPNDPGYHGGDIPTDVPPGGDPPEKEDDDEQNESS
jgi:hypothetical protein